jgi:hypothetical protein
MSKNHDIIRNVFEVLITIIIYLAIIEIMAIFYIVSFILQLLPIAAAYTNRKKCNSSKGAFTTGVLLRVSQGLMKK